MIPIKDALMILSRRQRPNGIPITERQDTQLIPFKILLNNNLITSVSKLAIKHDLLQGLVSL